METNGKSLILQRTLGAALLVAAAATLIPLALDGDGIKAGREQVQIPDEPTFEMQLDDHERVRIHMLQAKGAIQRAEQESAAAAAAADNAQAGAGGQGGSDTSPSDPKAPPVGTPAKASTIAGTAPTTAGAQEKALPLPTEPTAAGTRKMEDLVQKLSQPGATSVALPKEPAAPASSLGPDVAEAWTIQMGAFKDRVNADKIVAQLVAHGYRAYLGTQTPGVYRVFVGPEVRRERADQLRDRVAADTGNKGVVVRYLP